MRSPVLIAWMAFGSMVAGCATSLDTEPTTETEATALSVASFTYAPSPVSVGVPITFDGSASVCGTSACSYTWQWFFPRSGGGSQVGGQMGHATIVTYTFDAFAASKPYVIVQLKVTENNTTHNFVTTSQSFVVSP